MSAENDDLRAELRRLSERLDRLESRGAADAHQPTPALDPDVFWALGGLRERLAADGDDARGAVMLVGELSLPTGEPVSWQQGAHADALLESEWTERASAFAALGHPVRLELLRHILAGTRATSELAAIDGLGTTGQLHHHLRQLLAVGWLRQAGRGAYEVPAQRVVPLLACLVGAER
ncbi:winged helix-turn-helix domain-containing protein [Salinibacterium sp. ZJ77]|uniref:ArsR/SmtB family transcription factor n=1 Tax=Salinibacterium sp. ZJ77 TaxID=2708337 RepID=UPI00141FE655|nr:winged helix-turn-helix domain-containing protein [Salinibacterium sp. ZJ77]